MDLPTIAAALQRPRTVPMAVQALFNYNNPLSEKEHAQLTEFNRLRQEQFEGGLKVDGVPEEMRLLAQRPIKAIHPLMVIQCVVSAAKLPQVQVRYQRRMHRQLLPFTATATPLTLQEWYAALHVVAQLSASSSLFNSSRTMVRCAEELLRLASPVVFEVPAVVSKRSVAFGRSSNVPVSAAGGSATQGGRVCVVPRKADNSTVRLKEVSREDVQALFFKLLASVTCAYAIFHASSHKFSLARDKVRSSNKKEQQQHQHSLWEVEHTGNAVFLESGSVRRLRRFMGTCCATDNGAAACVRARATLAPVEAAAVTIVAFGNTCSCAAACAGALTKEIITATIKAAPGTLYLLLGSGRTIADALGGGVLANSQDVISACLYNMGLTTVTSEMFSDYVSVLASAPGGDLAELFASRGKDAFMQLFAPFVTNAKVLTRDVAVTISKMYAQLLLRMKPESYRGAQEGGTASSSSAAALPLLTAFIEAVAFALSTRCRSPPEKAAVLRLVCEMVSALPQECRESGSTAAEAALFDVAPLVSVLDREVATPAVESASEALRLVGLFRMEAYVTDGLLAAVKMAKKEDDVRRALLVQLSPKHTPVDVIGLLVDDLLDECVEVQVVRPDAFLALAFVVEDVKQRGAEAAAVKIAKLAPLLSTADVLGQLLAQSEDTYEADRVAVVAIALATVAKQYDALAMLLTHVSGRIRKPLVTYVNGLDDATSVTALWNSAMHGVCGLGTAAKPAILSGSAGTALRTITAALLRHLPKLAQDSSSATGPACASIAKTLVQVLTCFGHDNVQSEDACFFLPGNHPHRRYRTREKHVDVRDFNRVFTDEYNYLLSEPRICTALMAALRNTMLHAHEHESIAACRAVALLLTVNANSASTACAAASEDIFVQLLASITESAAYFQGLDERDRAIAAEWDDVMDEYEDCTLREQQLLKNYPERAPKGTSEDDFLDMKKKDAIALAKGRDALRAEVAKRTKVILPTVRQHKMPFLAARLVGTNGKFNKIGVSILYPSLQSILNRSAAPSRSGVNSKINGSDDDVATVPAVLSVLSLDAIVGLLACTPLSTMVRELAVAVAYLTRERTLTVADVAAVSARAQALRMALPQMLPAPLFVVLAAFARVAFKPGRGGNAIATTIPIATQHQLLSVLLQNLGQPDLPQPTETLELFAGILQSFPSLYKSVQQGFHTLMAMIPSSRLSVVEAGLFNTVSSVREVSAASFGRFTHFRSCRRALVLSQVFVKDNTSANIAKNVIAIVSDPKYEFVLEPSDWTDLLYFLATYGQYSANAQRIVEVMTDLFARGDTTEAQQRAWAEDITTVGGIASVIAFQALSPTYKGDVPAFVMEYLCSLTEALTTGESLMKSILSAGRVVLKDMDLATLKKIAAELQARLAKPPKDATQTHKELYLATATVWLTIISCRLQETELLEAIIDQQNRTLNNSQSAMVHRCVCESMREIAQNEKVRNSEKLDEFMSKCIKQVVHSGSYIKKKAHAWGLVGVLQGLGLSSLRRYVILETITEAGNEKKQAEKSGAMVLVEVLCDVLGTRFEPYALSVSPILLEGVADLDPKISECADDASRVMMRNLTGVGLRQLIPRLVAMLDSDVAKKRVAPLQFIGYVAFCSPKQLAATLPQIMKHITGCLFDVNNSVSVAAFNALKRVAGVVSNPEIQEHVDLILNAMRLPSTETEPALDALLYTRFINVVDPASLALIIPVLSRGLSGQMPHTRAKAAQIVASMVNLVNDAKTLEPYAEDLVRLLEEASQDPQTEARTTAAKAIGCLSSAVGGKLIDDIACWSFGVLQKIHSGTIEKSGAAQVFVELVQACGESMLELYFPTIEAGMTDEKPAVREGFLYIMIYAPSTFDTDSFQKFLPVAFPWVLEGLSHYSDKVRDVALAAGDSIISLYGTRNLSLVLDPLLNGVVSEVTTLRHSSLLLSSKLMLHLVAHIKKKMRIQAALNEVADEDRAALAETIEATTGIDQAAAATEEEGGILTMENARDVEKRGVSILASLEEMLGADNLVRMLSAIFCGRNEHGAAVRNDTNMAWQACVASIRAAISKIFDGLVRLLVHFGSSDNPDCVEVAAKTIEFTSRMNETIERFVDVLCDTYHIGGRRNKLGSLVCLSTVVQFADSKKLISMGGQIVGCVLPGMQDADEAVQEAARDVFAKVSRSVGPRLIESAVVAQLATSVRGVVEVVKVKPSIALSLIFKHLKAQETHTESNVELIDAILDVEEAEDEMCKYIDDTIHLLLRFTIQRLPGATDVMQKFIEMCPREYEDMPIEYIQKALNVPERRLGALLCAEAFCYAASIENTEGIINVLRAAITALGDDDNETRLNAARMIPEIISSLEQRVVDEMPEEDQQDVTASKRAAGRYLLQYLEVFQLTLAVTARAFISSSTPEFTVLGEGEPRLFESLMAFYNRGLDYGTPQQKVEAVECIQDLMEFAPRAISAAAANTVAGRCSKVLFTRNEGSVVLALVRLCLQLMDYPASGKEKMVEGTMALAMFNAALCDSGEARVLALRVVIQLLHRSEKYADLILGTVVTKKAAVDSPLLRTVMCRFISTVMRYANFEKAFPHIQKLMDLVRPIWENAESPAQATAACVAVGALCKSASMSEEALSDIKERALASTSTKGVQALAGFALVYSLTVCAPGRTDQTFLDVAAEHLRAAAAFGIRDKMTAMWLLRAAGAIAATKCVSAEKFKPDVYMPLMRLANNTDEQMMSTAQYFYDAIANTYPASASLYDSFSRETSSQWNVVGQFDADLDDELCADTVY